MEERNTSSEEFKSNAEDKTFKRKNSSESGSFQKSPVSKKRPCERRGGDVLCQSACLCIHPQVCHSEFDRQRLFYFRRNNFISIPQTNDSAMEEYGRCERYFTSESNFLSPMRSDLRFDSYNGIALSENQRIFPISKERQVAQSIPGNCFLPSVEPNQIVEPVANLNYNSIEASKIGCSNQNYFKNASNHVQASESKFSEVVKKSHGSSNCSSNFVLDTKLWTRVDRGDMCSAEMCSLRNEISKIARRRHYHAKCQHRHNAGVKSGMIFHHHQMEKIRKHQSAHQTEDNRRKGGTFVLNSSISAAVRRAGVELYAPEKWNEKLTKCLISLVESFSNRTPCMWKELSLELNRSFHDVEISPVQCMLHWRFSINENKPVTGVKTWSDVEDERLYMLVKLFGLKWSLITQMLPGREPKQCRERYLNVVSPTRARKPWSYDEDCLLLRVHDRLSNRFVKTAKHFTGRTCKEIRERWQKINKVHKDLILTQHYKSFSDPKLRESLENTPETANDGIESAPVDTVNCFDRTFFHEKDGERCAVDLEGTERENHTENNAQACPNAGYQNTPVRSDREFAALSLLGMRRKTE